MLIAFKFFITGVVLVLVLFFLFKIYDNKPIFSILILISIIITILGSLILMWIF